MTKRFTTDLRQIIYRIHAVRQMFQRSISEESVRAVIGTGDVIEEYPDDKPYPSFLISGIVKRRPLHVVVAYNKVDHAAIVITAYEPDPVVWESDFRRRRNP